MTSEQIKHILESLVQDTADRRESMPTKSERFRDLFESDMSQETVMTLCGAVVESFFDLTTEFIDQGDPVSIAEGQAAWDMFATGVALGKRVEQIKALEEMVG